MINTRLRWRPYYPSLLKWRVEDVAEIPEGKSVIVLPRQSSRNLILLPFAGGDDNVESPPEGTQTLIVQPALGRATLKPLLSTPLPEVAVADDPAFRSLLVRGLQRRVHNSPVLSFFKEELSIEALPEGRAIITPWQAKRQTLGLLPFVGGEESEAVEELPPGQRAYVHLAQLRVIVQPVFLPDNRGIFAAPEELPPGQRAIPRVEFSRLTLSLREFSGGNSLEDMPPGKVALVRQVRRPVHLQPRFSSFSEEISLIFPEGKAVFVPRAFQRQLITPFIDWKKVEEVVVTDPVGMQMYILRLS